MANEFIIKNGFHSKGDSQVTGSLNITDSLTVNGSAVGAAFPFTGDAQITGSLIVSGSTPLTLQGGTTNSDTVLLAENSSGLDLLTVKGDGELIINNATNGLTGKLSFGNGISDGFIYMQDLATGPSSKYSIPQRTSNDDSSLQFLVGNTAAGPKLFPHKDTSQGLADRSVIEIDLYNSGNNSRGLDFIVGGAAVTTTYQPKLWRFFSWDGVNDPDSGNVERLSIGNSPLTTGGDAIIAISSSRVGIGAPSPSASLEINPPSGSFPSLIVSGSSEFIGNISGSATSTASFGTYLGDGSQLTGVSVFPFTGDAQITGSLTITGSAALAVTSSENISVAKYENGAHQSYCIPEVHYHSWYYNTTTRPIFEDDYINFGWAGTDLELTVKQLGTDDNVHITKNISNAYSFISVTNTSQFDLDGSMSAEESSFFYITNIHDDSYPMYKVIVTRAATDGTNKNMYMLVEKIKKTL